MVAITPSMHFFSCCIGVSGVFPPVMLRYLRTVTAWLHVPRAKEILVVGSAWPTFNPYVTNNANRAHDQKNRKIHVSYRSQVPQCIAKKDVISLWENHSHLSCMCIHLLHLIPKNEIPKNEIWSTPLKVEAFVKIPGSTQKGGLFGHHLWTEERHEKYDGWRPPGEKRTRWQQCSWTCSNFALLCTAKRQSHHSPVSFQTPQWRRRIQYVISLSSLMVLPTLIAHATRPKIL